MTNPTQKSVIPSLSVFSAYILTKTSRHTYFVKNRLIYIYCGAYTKELVQFFIKHIFFTNFTMGQVILFEEYEDVLC